MNNLRALTVTPILFAVTGIATADAVSDAYEYDFQRLHGSAATFHVSGPATGGSPDVEGDAFLNMVEYPSGDTFIHWYKPERVFDVSYSGDPLGFGVRGGTRTTTPLHGLFPIGDFDGNDSDTSSADLVAMESAALQAFQSNNINTYVDAGSGSDFFYMTVEFAMPVMDNDPDADDFGEILFMERGSGFGNSFIRIQAVEEDGTPLGPWFVINPHETTQTTPITSVMRSDQKIGTTAIDVSRLGVSEFQYLRISNEVVGEAAYVPFSGSDRNPDFKLMVVITNEQQLGAMMAFD